MKPISQTPTGKPLVCRPIQVLWILVVTFAAIAVAFPWQAWSGARPYTPKTDFLPLVALCAMFGLPALGTAFYLLHCRVVTDASGLWIYGWHPRHFIAWNAIEDYELRFPTSNQGNARDASGTRATRAYIQSSGKWRHLSDLYLPRQPLLDTIEREAKWAKASSWKLGEIRDDGEWPKTYSYRDVSGWRLIGAYLFFTLTLLGLQFFKAATYGVAPLLANISLIWSGLSPWGRVGFVATPLMLMGAMPLVILAQYPAIRARRAYLNQKIVAHRDGLTWHQDGAQTAVRWDEITSYHLETVPGHFAPTRFVIETRRARISWLSGISGGKALQTLVEERASNAITQKWRHLGGADEDVLGGAASLYRGGNVGVGAKIHHYRTRTTRVLLLLGAFIVAALFIPTLMGHTFGVKPGQAVSKADEIFGVLFVGAYVIGIGAATIFGVLGWLFASIECEADGLRQRGVWGERFLRWDELENFSTNGYNFSVKGRQKTIRFAAFIADASGLRDEIQKRSGVLLANRGQNQLD